MAFNRICALIQYKTPFHGPPCNGVFSSLMVVVLGVESCDLFKSSSHSFYFAIFFDLFLFYENGWYQVCFFMGWLFWNFRQMFWYKNKGLFDRVIFICI